VVGCRGTDRVRVRIMVRVRAMKETNCNRRRRWNEILKEREMKKGTDLDLKP
jgi:hypothetical protein